MLKKIIHFGICLVVLSLPLYLLKVKIYWIPFTVLELMIYGLFVLWLIKNSSIVQTIELIKRSGYFYPIFLIFFGLTISTLFSSDLLISAGIWKGWFIAPWLFFIALLDSAQSQKQIKDILIALTLSGGGVAIIGLWSWFLGDLTYDGRLKAFYLSPNHLAMYLAPILILSFGLWGFLKTIWQKVLLLAVSCLLLVVIYLTYSYGAWLGLAGAVIFLLIISRLSTRRLSAPRSGNKYLLFVIFILLLVLLIFFQLQTEKAQNLLNFSRSSLESRLIIWRTAIEIIKDHPLIGVGPGLFQKYYLAYQPEFKPYLEWAAPQPHNLFLAFWLQTGLIGLIGFIWLLIRFIKKQRWGNFLGGADGAAPAGAAPSAPCSQKIPPALLLVLKAALAYILIHGLVDTTYWKNDLAIIFWLIIALGSITSRLSYSQKTNSPLGPREEAE